MHITDWSTYGRTNGHTDRSFNHLCYMIQHYFMAKFCLLLQNYLVICRISWIQSNYVFLTLFYLRYFFYPGRMIDCRHIAQPFLHHSTSILVNQHFSRHFSTFHCIFLNNLIKSNFIISKSKQVSFKPLIFQIFIFKFFVRYVLMSYQHVQLKSLNVHHYLIVHLIWF